ncbi:MAG: nitrile hydratase subunit beta [Mycobacteriaceae bacterium]|nr:nitrile hydratase subunit beta [Mycobacteriaceae bacterium]
MFAMIVGPGEVDARLRGQPAQADRRRISRLRRVVTSRVLSMLLRPQLPRWLAGVVLPRALGSTRRVQAPQRFSGRSSIPTPTPSGGPARRSTSMASFQAADLWADAAEPDTEVRVDLYGPYLQPYRGQL